jgi:autotransporter-associated beta strand protein
MRTRHSVYVRNFAISAAGLLLAQSAQSATYTWARGVLPTAPSTAFSWNNSTLNGDATNGNNWNAAGNAFPNAVGDIAIVANNAGANNQTINLNQNITIGAIGNIGSMNGNGVKTIAAGGAFTLTFDNGSSDASISKLNTTNNNASIISAPIAIAGNGNLNIVNSSTNTLTLSGAVSGTNVNLAVPSGTGAVLLTGNHSGLSGTFTHSSGTSNTQFNSATSGSANVAYTISGGELIFAANGNYTVQMGALSSTAGNIRGGNTATGTATIEVGNLGTSTSIAGNLNNGATKVLALTKVGGGTFTVNGSNNFSGGTNVNVGALFVNGSLTSAVNTVAVASGATLAGSGTISGGTTISSGAFLDAGSAANTIGALTFTSTLGLASGATASFQLNSSTGLSDSVVANGVTLGGASLSLADLGSGIWSGAPTFVLVDNTSNDSIGGTFTGLNEGASVTVGSNTFWISYVGGTGNDITLSTIPEPSAFAALAGLAGLGFAASRRRRRA